MLAPACGMLAENDWEGKAESITPKMSGGFCLLGGIFLAWKKNKVGEVKRYFIIKR